MSKTYRIKVSLDIKMVLTDAEVKATERYMDIRSMPEAFRKYLETLGPNEKLEAFIKNNVKDWFKGELERGRRTESGIVYAPVQVTVEGKTD
jgi:hypothetical protein